MDPELGRFISLDPVLGKLSSPQTLNRYVYCVNNPLRFTDPTGEWSLSLKGLSNWWDKNWQTFVLVAVCAAITIGTGGAGAGLAAAVAYGAFAGAGTNVALAYLYSGGKLTLQGAVSAAISGAITGGIGAITAGVGSGAISLGESLGARIAGSTFARLGAAAGIGALGGEGSYLAGEATKMAMTGGREGKITLRGMLFSAAAGTATGFIMGGMGSLGLKPSLGDFAKMNVPQATQAIIPGAFFTAAMSTLKYLAKPWIEGDRALTLGAQVMTPTFQGGSHNTREMWLR